MHVNDLDTPSVLIDLDRMERNIWRMQSWCSELGLAFRPHVKTHKIPDIARMQIEAGAVGIACQKVSEAQIFAEAGFNDIQIPYPIVSTFKTSRLADLALYNKITVAADSIEVLQGLIEASTPRGIQIRVLVELMTEMERTGTTPDQAVKLAKAIEADDHLHFAGLLVYPSMPSIRPVLQETLSKLSAAGIGVDTVSGGGSLAALYAREVPELTELRVGGYVFSDWSSVNIGAATLDDCAMTVLSTVISRPTPTRAMLDSGTKTLSSDRYEGTFGYIVEYPEAVIYNLNEEHAYADVSQCESQPAVGERLHIVPVHTCVVTNLHNQLYGVRGDIIEVFWQVAARGMVW